ncbi:CBS and ACT domain-containing protein [Desulfomonile tiedjei]|uniref:CBS domain-containing protein n=1 Tax=Desulfomonile tiedjei (strain ATCC 49306 / DSM 6799 / DCB-1) TaxID=706587 RepID=I4CAH5_DESTA|nr:CBS and ACT domain-containing protein [Desulfomonile tiedjei]AFM26566.1 CBS domain-containing protein [Desulfomonile tiedjei DSM 6799]
MLVKDWMTKKVVTLEVTDSLQHAINLMMEDHVSMFPVLEEGKLVGIVTDRDLKRASPSDMARLDIQQIIYHVSRVEVGAIMSRYPITVPLNWTVEEAAEILMTNKISGCPVIDEKGEIRGLITKSDLFKALIALSGLSHRGFQFGFLLEDHPGSIKVVTDIIRKYGARLCSILSSYEKAPQGFRNVYIRAFDVEREKVAELEAELKSKAKMLYMVDHRENTRKIYE